MNSKSYYFYLSSKDSLDVYPTNTAASFTVNLPIPLSLTGNWEIGLIDISFNKNFTVVPKELYFCLNVVNSSYVQGTLLKTLRRISLCNSTSNEFVTYFPVVRYVSVTLNYLNYFQVKILSENLQEAAFKSGNLYCTLHLKKC